MGVCNHGVENYITEFFTISNRPLKKWCHVLFILFIIGEWRFESRVHSFISTFPLKLFGLWLLHNISEVPNTRAWRVAWLLNKTSSSHHVHRCLNFQGRLLICIQFQSPKQRKGPTSYHGASVTIGHVALTVHIDRINHSHSFDRSWLYRKWIV